MMLGIFGLVSVDGNLDYASNEFKQMVGVLPKFEGREPDFVRSGNVFLGRHVCTASHRRSDLTQPFQIEGWTFVCEARLDTPSCSSICPEHKIAERMFLRQENDYGSLFGDWLIAGSNPDTGELHLAREPYGQRALYYTRTNRVFAFATSISLLRKLNSFDASLDELALGAIISEWPRNSTDTVFSNIKVLPPGHRLVFGQKGLEVSRYWSMEKALNPVICSYEEAAEELGRQMQRAVRCRMDDRVNTATTLSAGLDSSAVTFFASDMKKQLSRGMDAYCSVPLYRDEMITSKGRFGDESTVAAALAEQFGNVRLHLINSKHLSATEGLKSTVRAMGQPFYNSSNDNWLNSLVMQAASDGNHQLLVGSMGNVGFSWGPVRWESVPRLIKSGRWRSLAGRVLRSRPVGSTRACWRQYSPVGRQWIDNTILLRNSKFSRVLLDGMLNEGFDPKSGPEGFFDGRSLYKTSIDERLDWIEPMGSSGDAWDLIGKANGIEVIDPTADTELLLFTLSLPNRVFTGPKVESRWLAKASMRPWLPASVIDNPKRGEQATDFIAQLQADGQNIEQYLERMTHNDLISAMVDVQKLRSIFSNIQKRPASADQWGEADLLMNGLSVALFLFDIP